MDTKLLLLVFAAYCTVGANALDWNSLHVKFDPLLKGYYNIPLTKAKMLVSDYYFMARDEDLNMDFYSLKWDPRVSFGLDMNGNIGGVRVGYIKADVGSKAASKSLPFPTKLFDNNPMYQNGTFWDVDVWYNTVLFASPDVLKSTGRTNTDMVADDIYIKLNGEWTAMPRAEKDAEALGFVKQNCFVGLGRHYVLGLSKEAKCEDLQGVFLNYESKSLIGVGLIPFGAYTSSSDRTWFENVFDAALSVLAPDAPTCVNDWNDAYGVSSLHIMFKRFPRITLCNWPFN